MKTDPQTAVETDPSDTLASAEVRRKWVFSVEDWAEIRRLRHNEGMPIKVIARAMRCSKNTVKAALRSEGSAEVPAAGRGSVVDEVEWPTIPATVIAERIGWEHSIRILRDRVAELRPVYLPPDPASRTFYEPERSVSATCDPGVAAGVVPRGGDPGLASANAAVRCGYRS